VNESNPSPSGLRSNSLDSRESLPPAEELPINGGEEQKAKDERAIERFAQLLQLLGCLRWFRQQVLVMLFFSGLIGSLSIESVMPFILNMDVMTIFNIAPAISASDINTPVAEPKEEERVKTETTLTKQESMEHGDQAKEN